MDFYRVRNRLTKQGNIEVYPEFIVKRSEDLMIRGERFYAVWDESTSLWSTNEYLVQIIVDRSIAEELEKLRASSGRPCVGLFMSEWSTKSWAAFRAYTRALSDNYVQLDSELVYADTQTTRSSYASKKLPYSLAKAETHGYTKLSTTIYTADELQKLEWAIGAIVSGDAKTIQKFMVLYGEAGTGKSTMINIIQQLFVGYYTTFDAKALASNSNAFSTEVFKNNPLVAIQHDGDLSRIEDNTKINSIVSHEDMSLNEKYKSSYTSKINAFLFLGSNKPVKITDSKSGIIRRLLDVSPSGNLLPIDEFDKCVNSIPYELGGIAQHCLEVYTSLGKSYYNGYRPLTMIYQTDTFYNFVEHHYHQFLTTPVTKLKTAYDMYKVYCEESLVEFKLAQHKFREELKGYFREFYPRYRIGETHVRSCYIGFRKEKFDSSLDDTETTVTTPILELNCLTTEFDAWFEDRPAQLAAQSGSPSKRWAETTTKLRDIPSSELHYVQMPKTHIVIDFDLKDESGEKSKELNLKAAAEWPETYAEFSKSGSGVHLHYTFTGDIDTLARVYDSDIEVKVFVGDSALRRQFTACNGKPIATITSGLPRKEKKVINKTTVANEKMIRAAVIKNLKKEVHAATKPSIDFIHKILDDAYKSGVPYDVTDLRPDVMAFAASSSHQSIYCLKLVGTMKFSSEVDHPETPAIEGDPLVFYDVEVFMNYFIVVYKPHGGKKVVLVEPTSEQIETLFGMKLVGFYNRDYDNHIIYARYLGYTTEQLYELSQALINGSPNAKFREAYNISYTDVFDFSSAQNKKSLKQWQIELGLPHIELDLPWDKPVPEDMKADVNEYCGNDVDSTEAVFEHLSGDWAARRVISKLSGLSLNHRTNAHTIQIVMGNDRSKAELRYTHLDSMFPGYKYSFGKSEYRGAPMNEGGLVIAKPGMYYNVGVVDLASGHPTAIEYLNLFGKYTERYSDLKKARIACKHQDEDKLSSLLNGELRPFVDEIKRGELTFKSLSNGLKTVLNSGYGLTAASFDNAFRDPKNEDNIVAKYEALFMADLTFAVEARDYEVIHVKTDSIKIPNINPEIVEFVVNFASKYGFEMEMEDQYDKFCLVNRAVYIAHDQNGWHATGAQFAHPYVKKKLFDKQPTSYVDVVEIKRVAKGAMYIQREADPSQYVFQGRVGAFVPVLPGSGGGTLLVKRDDKYVSAAGAKDQLWIEAPMIELRGLHDRVDYTHHNRLVDEAKEAIEKFGDFDCFVNDPPPEAPPHDGRPLDDCSRYSVAPADFEKNGCGNCPEYINVQCLDGTVRQCRMGFDTIPF